MPKRNLVYPVTNVFQSLTRRRYPMLAQWSASLHLLHSSLVSCGGCHGGLVDLVQGVAVVYLALERVERRCSTRTPTSRSSSKTSPAWTKPKRRSWSLSSS